MVICNVIYGENMNSEDLEILGKLRLCKSINVLTDILNLDEGANTIFYGYGTASKYFDIENRKNYRISDRCWWTYTNSEIKFENWIYQFIKKCESEWFSYKDNGIDIIFDDFNLDDFIGKLKPYPLIHEGDYEIYIAEYSDGDITINSIKKETLEYAGINPKDFLKYIYSKLDYNFLTFESKRYGLIQNDKLPIFLDDLLFSISGELFEVKDVVNHFRNEFSSFKIDRSKVIVYYLKAVMDNKVDFILYK